MDKITLSWESQQLRRRSQKTEQKIVGEDIVLRLNLLSQKVSLSIVLVNKLSLANQYVLGEKSTIVVLDKCGIDGPPCIFLNSLGLRLDQLREIMRLAGGPLDKLRQVDEDTKRALLSKVEEYSDSLETYLAVDIFECSNEFVSLLHQIQ